MITVLYEDSAGATPNNFGPHMLVLACVADALGRPEDVWALKAKVDAVPKNGSGEVRKALREQGWYGVDPVFAMLDADEVRSLYRLDGTACKRTVLDAIRAEAAGAVTVVLLEQNMEDVTQACCLALHLPHDKKPTPQERDAICHRAAKDPLVRKHVLTAVPSFKRLVDGIRDALR